MTNIKIQDLAGMNFKQVTAAASKSLLEIASNQISVTKSVGLWRAAITLKSPEEDKLKASAFAFNYCLSALEAGGMDKYQAKSLVNNARGSALLAEKVILNGLKETIYNAVPAMTAAKACKALKDDEAIASANKLKLTAKGRLPKKGKEFFGLVEDKEAPKKERTSSGGRPTQGEAPEEVSSKDKLQLGVATSLDYLRKNLERLEEADKQAARKELLALVNLLGESV